MLVCVAVPAILLGAVLVGGGGDAATGRGGTVAIGSLAPDFTLPALDGPDVSLHDYSGHRVVLTFFASWCIPCERETAALREAVAAHPGELDVLGVMFRDLPGDARAFLAEHRAHWPALDDRSLAVASTYGVNTIPVTFFIGPDGRVVDRVFGITSADDLAAPLATLLAAT